MLAYNKKYAFNAICPYYTMFPLEYPLRVMKRYRSLLPIVSDPFCGRGTTIYAARALGLESYGIDSSPIAAAIAQAKLATASVKEVLDLAKSLLARDPLHVPSSEFFRHAYSDNTLRQICSLREGLLSVKTPTNASAILTAASLGCLHGPLSKGNSASYFSNQMPRTFASKPDYSVRYWKSERLSAPEVNVVDVIRKKLSRIPDLEDAVPSGLRNVRCGDSRSPSIYKGMKKSALVITSPPYYGMRTYVQDQWLRMWFVGGGEHIDYENEEQVTHSGHAAFITDLAKVWTNVRKNTENDAHLYVRFGTLPSVKSDAKELMLASLEEAQGWTLVSVRSAKNSSAGKRQADQMGRSSQATKEFDFHAVRN